MGPARPETSHVPASLDISTEAARFAFCSSSHWIKAGSEGVPRATQRVTFVTDSGAPDTPTVLASACQTEEAEQLTLTR